MARAVDVAAYILDSLGNASTMKLQKLVFYSHAYHLVHHGGPLVSERIEAWANGPVIPDLFRFHRDQFVITRGFFSAWAKEGGLLPHERESVDRTIEVMGVFTGNQLSELTHREDPWCKARIGLAPGERSHNEITQDAIAAFYSSRACTNPLFA